ncbi:MAG: NADAR family protein [Sphingobacteriales bacterium]|nr:MAG: NADAR family protein [Sphingobacteriales bacterium]
MKSKYNINWLLEKYESGENLKFIYFWGNTKKSGEIDKSCFSQWYESSFELENVNYKTAEHWMMAQKAHLFNDIKAFDKIINCKKPGEAKEIGRNVLNYNEGIWNETKFEIVKTGNIHKFNQNSELAEYLLKTADRILVEASPVDTVWGIGLSQDNPDINNIYVWRGENLLGFVLMEVRDFITKFGFFEPIKNTFLPPWLKFPNIYPEDLFWRMGKGEDYIFSFSKFYLALNEKEKIIYKLTFPQPFIWKEFYD